MTTCSINHIITHNCNILEKNKIKNKDENKGTPDTRYDKGIQGYKACKL